MRNFNPLAFSDMDQSSPEWLLSRVGRITASNAIKLTTTAKSTPYKMDMITEISKNKPTEIFGKALDFGNENEPLAREHFESVNFVSVEEIGLVLKKDNQYIGASVDGFFEFEGEERNIEIKCPFNPSNHLKYFLGSKIPKDYEYQMQFQMWVTERKSCVFVSFRPDMPDHLKMFEKIVLRDEEIIKELEKCSYKFLKKLHSDLDILKLPYVLTEA